MLNKHEFIEELEKKRIHFHIWGRHGKSVVKELENTLDFEFDSEAILFIEEIGNISIRGREILISGDEEKTYNCITETKNAFSIKKEKPDGVKIMDFAGLSYILYRDGSIKAYEHVRIDFNEVIESYDSLSSLIKLIIEEAVL